ncbi:MAG: polysaccharide biosynthesis tyrosine autokinase [Actinomycetota bacterium]
MTTSSPDLAGEYGLLDYWSIVRKRWPWVVIPVILLAAGAVTYSLRQPDRYEASASVLLADTASQRTLDPSSQNPGFLSRELSNEISLARSDAVERLVAAELGELPRLTITSEADADVLVFRASAPTAERAAEIANVWATNYIQVKRDAAVTDITAATASLQERLQELRIERQELRSPLDVLDRRIAGAADPLIAAQLQQEYDRLEDDLRYELELTTAQAEATVASLSQLELQAELASVGEARFVQVAAPPEQTSNAPLSRNLALGATLGLMVGFGLALLAETRDNTIKSAADVISATDLPVLASVPLASKKQLSGLPLSTQREPEGMFADGYHKVRSSLEFASFEQKLKTVLITSPNAAEGKSTTSSNLALAFSSIGKRTVLLDVDFRRASVHRFYGVEQIPGFSDVVLHGAELGSVAYAIREPGLDGLLVVPTGSVPPSPAAFVGTQGFLAQVERIKTQADVVIMDAPPLLAVSDAHTLGKHVDAVVLAARAGQTTKAELSEVASTLRQVGANVLGVVLVGVTEADGYGRRYYGGGVADARSDSGHRSVGSGNLWDTPAAEQTIDLDAVAQPAAHGANQGPSA